MDPRHFLRILSTRWPVVVALTLLGAAGGWITAPESTTRELPREDLTLYTATNLQFISNDSPLTPAQIIFFATFDDVPERVADRLGGDPTSLAAQVTVTHDNEVGLLRISSTNVDPQDAVEVADTFAEELRLWLDERAATSQAQRRDAVLQRIEALEQQVVDLDRDIDITSGTAEALRLAERDSALNQLRLERERFQSIAAEGVPTGSLELAQEAEAVPISGPAYYERVLRSTGVNATTSTTRPGGTTTTSILLDGSGLPDDFPVQAAVVEEPVNRNLRAAAGAAAGFVLGLGLIAVLARFDRRIRTRSDAESAFGLPVLCEVPPIRRDEQDEILSWTRPRSSTAEAHRALRTSLALASDAGAAPVERLGIHGDVKDIAVVLITSPSPGDGKSTTAANLAVVLAEAGNRVLVVDCDFRRPRMAGLLGVRGLEPFGDAPLAEISRDPSRFVSATEIERVHLAQTVSRRSTSPEDEDVGGEGCGTAPADAPTAMLRAQRQLVGALRYDFDVIVLDTAPLQSTNDAADLLPVADGVLFVARAGRTDIPDAEAAAERLERLQAPMLGVVLVASSGEDGRSSYSTYYDDEPAEPRPALSRIARRSRR